MTECGFEEGCLEEGGLQRVSPIAYANFTRSVTEVKNKGPDFVSIAVVYDI